MLVFGFGCMFCIVFGGLFIFESYDVVIGVFDYLGDYVVNEMVFVLDVFGFEIGFVFGVV